MALLKLGLVASLTSFPWKQPAGQLVPVNLRPGGASAPADSSQLSWRKGDLGTLCSSLSLAHFFATGAQFEGEVSEWLVPACTFPSTCTGVAFITALGIPPLGTLLSGGVPLLTIWLSSLFLENLKDENRRNV